MAKRIDHSFFVYRELKNSGNLSSFDDEGIEMKMK